MTELVDWHAEWQDAHNCIADLERQIADLQQRLDAAEARIVGLEAEIRLADEQTEKAKQETALLRSREQLAIEMCAEATKPKLENRNLQQRLEQAQREIADYEKIISENAASVFGQENKRLNEKAVELESQLEQAQAERDVALGLLPGKLKGVQALADEQIRCFYERAVNAEQQLAALREEREWRTNPPTETTWALVIGDGAIATRAWNQARQRWEDWEGCTAPGLVLRDITHWMPIPAPPATEPEEPRE